MPKLRVTLVRSTIGFPEVQKRTARALGLGRLHKTVELPDNPQTRGMVWAIRHLVKYETMPDETPEQPTSEPGTAEADQNPQAQPSAEEEPHGDS